MHDKNVEPSRAESERARVTWRRVRVRPCHVMMKERKKKRVREDER